MAPAADFFLNLVSYFYASARVIERGGLGLGWLLLVTTGTVWSRSHQLKLFVVVGVVRIRVNLSNQALWALLFSLDIFAQHVTEFFGAKLIILLK